jgi:predicted NBD/HSP70 family sugar kinase
VKVWSAHCILFVLVVEGIGTGLILNGEVYVGSRIGIGGFGHISFDPNGPLCSCGAVGCWEAVASDAATLKRFWAGEANAGKQVNNMSDLIQLAIAGDAGAQLELHKTAANIGRGIKGLAQGLAPEIIVVGGQIASAWPMIEATIANELHSEYLVEGVSRPEVRPASVQQPVFFGAFPVALRNVLHRRTKKVFAARSKEA